MISDKIMSIVPMCPFGENDIIILIQKIKVTRLIKTLIIGAQTMFRIFFCLLKACASP